jgi:glyoxylase-like metal-dependent hydrolase (beta-lactamase superfamily II)
MRPDRAPTMSSRSGATGTQAWHEVVPGVLLFRDSCNVYAVQGPEGCLLVDAGTGLWLDHLDELPVEPVVLACTHFFRDHSAGAVRACERGIPVFVPEGEKELFADPALHFLRRESFIVYDNYWDHFAPIESIPVAGLLADHETLRLAGLEVEVVPLPGATLTQVGLELTLPQDGRRVVFCGETIHSPGRVARIAPLQYGYNDLPGAWNVIVSSRRLRRRTPVALLPSLGEPILASIDGALEALELNLRQHVRGRDDLDEAKALDADQLERVTDHVWRGATMTAYGTFVVADSGRALAIDFGYGLGSATGETRSAPHLRRGSLEPVCALQERTGVEGVDVVLVSHYHDDHVASIKLLQRVFRSECWCPDWFSDLLEEPADFAFPCIWPVPTRVDRRIPADEPAVWEGISFRATPMTGHTRFSAAIAFEADGVRFAHTGDQYHLDALFESSRREQAPDWLATDVLANHVYRNGAFLDSFARSASWLREWRPDVVLSGHQPAMWTNDAFFDRIDEWAQAYERMHRESMVLGDDETHFGLDSWGGWIRPYRSHVPEPGPIPITATVRNPLPATARLDVKLVGPSGWHGSSARMDAAPRAEVSCALSITPAGQCRRQPIAVELTANGVPFGQVAEALVTVGGSEF